jgi:hypothetical protein
MTEHEGTNDMSNATSLLKADCELDKAGGAWFLTAWLDVKPRLALRVRIIREFGAGAFDVACEVRRPGQTEFESIASFASVDQFALREAYGCELPETWRREFLAMFHKLSHILNVVDLAGRDGDRYSAEPLSSRDYLLFGAADDMPLPR